MSTGLLAVLVLALLAGVGAGVFQAVSRRRAVESHGEDGDAPLAVVVAPLGGDEQGEARGGLMDMLGSCEGIEAVAMDPASGLSDDADNCRVQALLARREARVLVRGRLDHGVLRLLLTPRQCGRGVEVGDFASSWSLALPWGAEAGNDGDFSDLLELAVMARASMAGGMSGRVSGGRSERTVSLRLYALIPAMDEILHGGTEPGSELCGQAWAVLGQACLSLGRLTGENELFEQADKCLTTGLAETGSEGPPRDLAVAMHALGLVHMELGLNEPGIEKLERALMFFDAALTHWQRIQSKADCAGAWQCMGRVLAMLGERESVSRRLDQAVAAFDSALADTRQEDFPQAWASAWHHKGAVLALAGRLGGDGEKLRQALEALDKALKARDPKMPGGSSGLWAATRRTQGQALEALARLEGEAKFMIKAELAFEDCIKAMRREDSPLEWAAVQVNLGEVLQYSSGRRGLKRAVKAYGHALSVVDRGLMPMLWAGIRHNQGSALMRLGEREKGTETLGRAVAALKEALEAQESAGEGLDTAATRCTLGLARLALFDRTRDSGTARKGLSDLEQGAGVLEAAGDPRAAAARAALVRAGELMAEAEKQPPRP